MEYIIILALILGVFYGLIQLIKSIVLFIAENAVTIFLILAVIVMVFILFARWDDVLRFFKWIKSVINRFLSNVWKLIKRLFSYLFSKRQPIMLFGLPIIAILISFFSIGSIAGSLIKNQNDILLVEKYKEDSQDELDQLMSLYNDDILKYNDAKEVYDQELEEYNKYLEEEYSMEVEKAKQEYQNELDRYESSVSAYEQSVERYNAAYDREYQRAKENILYEGIDFKIRTSYETEYNNHVGNDWYRDYHVYVNGKECDIYDTVTISLGDYVSFYSVAEESDKYPDVGSGSSGHTVTVEDFTDGFSSSHDVYVYENGGRYRGNSAMFVYKYKLIPMEDYTKKNVEVDTSRLPTIMEKPTKPIYNDPEPEMSKPKAPALPLKPTISDVDVKYPDLDYRIGIIDAYGQSRAARIGFSGIAALVIYLFTKKVKEKKAEKDVIKVTDQAKRSEKDSNKPKISDRDILTGILIDDCRFEIDSTLSNDKSIWVFYQSERELLFKQIMHSFEKEFKYEIAYNSRVKMWRITVAEPENES